MPKYWSEDGTQLFNHHGREILVREGQFARLDPKKGNSSIVKVREIGEYGIFVGVEAVNSDQGWEVMAHRLTPLTSDEAMAALKSEKPRPAKKKKKKGEDELELETEIEDEEPTAI